MLERLQASSGSPCLRRTNSGVPAPHRPVESTRDQPLRCRRRAVNSLTGNDPVRREIAAGPDQFSDYNLAPRDELTTTRLDENDFHETSFMWTSSSREPFRRQAATRTRAFPYCGPAPRFFA